MFDSWSHDHFCCSSMCGRLGEEIERAGGGGRRGVEERRWWKNLERESVVGGRKKMMWCLKSLDMDDELAAM